jgi:hypothetical protein
MLSVHSYQFVRPKGSLNKALIPRLRAAGKQQHATYERSCRIGNVYPEWFHLVRRQY